VALVPYQQIGISGAAVTFAAATAGAGGDQFIPDDRGFAIVHNGSGSAVTATLVVPGSIYGQPRTDVTISVPAGADRFIGPMASDLADTAVDGYVDITYSSATTVTVAAVRI
jgi:hypothetical protein